MRDADPAQLRLAMLAVWLVPILWTVNYVVARKAPGVIGPYMLAFGRWTLAAAILLCFCGRELWQRRADIAAVWWQYLVLGFLGMMICGAWVYQGARSSTALNMALIYSTAPVLIGLGAGFWLGERFGSRQVVGVMLALAGVVNVVVRGQWTELASVQFAPGDAWIAATTIAWATYALLLKRWVSDLSATARLAAICIGGVITLLPFAIWESGQPGLTHWGTQALLLVVAAGVVPGVGAYWIYAWAQKILGASRVAVALYLSPLYTAAVAWLMLGETPGWHHAVGAAMILPGVYLVASKGREKHAKAASGVPAEAP